MAKRGKRHEHKEPYEVVGQFVVVVTVALNEESGEAHITCQMAGHGDPILLEQLDEHQEQIHEAAVGVLVAVKDALGGDTGEIVTGLVPEAGWGRFGQGRRQGRA